MHRALVTIAESLGSSTLAGVSVFDLSLSVAPIPTWYGMALVSLMNYWLTVILVLVPMIPPV